MKGVFDQEKWSDVARELEAEDIKLASYDNTLIPLLGSLKGRKILDYGCGPGVLALALRKLGIDVRVYDISPDMLKIAAEKIGKYRVYNSVDVIPRNHFDIVICNLVMCIVSDSEVHNITKNIWAILNNEGNAYIGFCNPLIYNVSESKLDLRYSNRKYDENHVYRKIKKEGGYEISEMHRPIEWYVAAFEKAGFMVVDKIFTPEYMLNGINIRDFIIFKLRKR